MRSVFKILKIEFIFLIVTISISNSFADNHNIYETLEKIQKDIKTLEKAVYSGNIEINNANSSNVSLNNSNNSEDVLTRHLLKLSEIVNPF